jgi:hypothetical protein
MDKIKTFTQQIIISDFTAKTNSTRVTLDKSYKLLTGIAVEVLVSPSTSNLTYFRVGLRTDNKEIHALMNKERFVANSNQNLNERFLKTFEENVQDFIVDVQIPTNTVSSGSLVLDVVFKLENA